MDMEVTFYNPVMGHCTFYLKNGTYIDYDGWNLKFEGSTFRVEGGIEINQVLKLEV